MSTTTDNLHRFLRTRRSIRRFKPDPVPESVLTAILTTATYAPSAHHRQPWRFAILADAPAKTKLADAMATDFQRDLEGDGVPSGQIQQQIQRSKDRILSAPTIVLLCLDMTEMNVYSDRRRVKAEFRMTVQSVAAAGMQLLLAAHAEGLGGVWACWPLFAQTAIQQALHLPEVWEPQGMIFIGYPQQIPEARERKPLQDITLYL
ncbi:MAG: nitroreductase family protein [Anaerolineales bacterium]|nr:nitroreductase family protein [Anaerolineales bacterium]